MICVSITNSRYQDILNDISDATIAEIRLDICQLSKKDIQQVFSIPVHLIATFRKSRFCDSERIKILKFAIDSGAKYVDIEIDSSLIFQREMYNYAKNHNCNVIISYHNFDYTPSNKDLNNIAKLCHESGADIIKIACKSNSIEDNERLISLYKKYKNKIISIGIGEIGKITRILAPSLGAPFTFAYPNDGNATADGQIDYESLKQILNNLKNE